MKAGHLKLIFLITKKIYSRPIIPGKQIMQPQDCYLKMKINFIQIFLNIKL